MLPESNPQGWVSTPAVTTDGFSFTNNEFFVSSSNHNVHRRASPAEIKAHFNASGSGGDHPAHWFEAQLKHYGLPVSKTKSVARMRLLDACNAGELVVPKDVAQLEARLKKEWSKSDREARKKLKESDIMSASGAGSKRKMSESAGASKKIKAETSAATVQTERTSTRETLSEIPKAEAQMAYTATKKPKQISQATPRTFPEALSSTPASTTKFSTKQTARCSRGASSQAYTKRASTADKATSSPPQKKQTAKSKRGGHSQGPGRSVDRIDSPPTSPPRVKQTARRSRPFGMQAAMPRSQSGGHRDNYSSDDSVHRDDESVGAMGRELPKLGLLNSYYDIKAADVTEQWSHYSEENLEVISTIAGCAMWAGFDLGVVSGVMFFPNRPWQSSSERLPFPWRGREDQGPIMYGNSHKGWVKFLGGGRFEGQLDFMGIRFRGKRRPGQAATSPRRATELEAEWNTYTEEEYAYENAARWR